MKFAALLLATFITLNICSQVNGEILGPVEYIYDSSKGYDLKAYVFSPKEISLNSRNPVIVMFMEVAGILVSLPGHLVSPTLSITKDDWFIELLINKSKPIDCTPAENINGKMPPSIIVAGKDDTVTPVYGSKLYHKNMLQHSNESSLFIYDGVGHLFPPSRQPDNRCPNPDKKIQKRAYDELDSFLKKLEFIK